MPLALLAIVAVGCAGASTQAPAAQTGKVAAAPEPVAVDAGFSMSSLRARVQTRVHLEADATPAPEPPAGVFERVHYAAPLGDNVAYVTPVRPGKPGPAMLWIAGGFDWGIGADAWQPGPRENDQSATAFRNAGIALMRPALRGSNGNPGRNECLAGEVDDVIAAARFLASRADVDPERIYLGGHSTGGTLALLVAQSTDLFRAVFAFGPVADAANYGVCPIPEDAADERALRRPTTHLSEVRTPTFVIEGAAGNSTSMGALEASRGQAPVRFIYVPGGDHFDVLAPGSEVVLAAILAGRDFDAPDAIGLPAILEAMGRPAPPPAALSLLRSQRMGEALGHVMRAGMLEECAKAQPQAICEQVAARVSAAALEGELSLAYGEVFSAAELEALARFYQSPVGRKIAALEHAVILAEAGLAAARPEPLTEAETRQATSFVQSETGQAAQTKLRRAVELAIDRYVSQM